MTICINAATMGAVDQYGMTSRVGGHHRLEINSGLLDAVADCPEIDTANVHIFAALLSACGHELMNYICKLAGLNSISSITTGLRCGGAGYVWEELLWGGVFVFIQ